jgi:hypothetical protein
VLDALLTYQSPLQANAEVINGSFMEEAGVAFQAESRPLIVM